MDLVVTDPGKATIDTAQFGSNYIDTKFLTDFAAQAVKRFFAELQSPADHFPQAGGYSPIIAPTTD